MFEECDLYTLDPFWKEIIFDCSKGRFPKGVTYNAQRNTLRTQDGVFEIPSGKKEKTELLLQLFRKGGLKSPQDTKNERDLFDNELEDSTVSLDCEWKKIKPRSLREGLILDYVCMVGNILKLTPNEQNKFFKFLNLGLFTRLIDSENIEYYDRKIHFISNINFDSKTKRFSFVDTSTTIQKTYRQSRKTKLCQNFNKFIKTMKSRQ